MARQVVFGAKGSTAYILETALAANLRLARCEAASDGSAKVPLPIALEAPLGVLGARHLPPRTAGVGCGRALPLRSTQEFLFKFSFSA